MMRKVMPVAVIFVLLFSLVLYTHNSTVKAQTVAPPNNSSEISLDTGNGFGSTGTYAMTFANVDVNVSTAITYTSSPTNGDSFTINTDGVYSVTYTDGAVASPGDILGISVNGSASTAFSSLAAGSRLCDQSMPYGVVAHCSVSLLLARGDVIRAHRTLATAGTGTNSIARFIIVKVVG